MKSRGFPARYPLGSQRCNPLSTNSTWLLSEQWQNKEIRLELVYSKFWRDRLLLVKGNPHKPFSALTDAPSPSRLSAHTRKQSFISGGSVRAGHPNYLRHRWTVVSLLVMSLLTAGCPRVLHLNYQPSTPIKGSGMIQVDPFLYAGHPTRLMKEKEFQSIARNPEVLFLSQDIGTFFTNALKAELAFGGYDVQPSSTHIVSGTIEHFMIDYVGENDQSFQIRATFHVARNDAPAYTTSCRSERQRTIDWMGSGLLIDRGIKDCIGEFMRQAQAAGAL